MLCVANTAARHSGGCELALELKSDSAAQESDVGLTTHGVLQTNFSLQFAVQCHEVLNLQLLYPSACLRCGLSSSTFLSKTVLYQSVYRQIYSTGEG